MIVTVARPLCMTLTVTVPVTLTLSFIVKVIVGEPLAIIMTNSESNCDIASDFNCDYYCD